MSRRAVQVELVQGGGIADLRKTLEGANSSRHPALQRSRLDAIGQQLSVDDTIPSTAQVERHRFGYPSIRPSRNLKDTTANMSALSRIWSARPITSTRSS